MPTRPTRREFLAVSTAAGAAALAPPVARAQADNAPNVLFIAVDDLRPQLGCYGAAQVHSPNIDALAARGLLFERAYCQQAVCGPSRASLMSGLRPDSSKVHSNTVPLAKARPDIVPLSRHFKLHGYETISLGKIYHHRGQDDPTGWSQPPWFAKGEWVGRGYLSPENKALCARIQADARTRLAELQKKDKNARPRNILKDIRSPRGPATECTDVADNAYMDGCDADEAIRQLRRLKGRRFFLAVGFHKPHLPFVAPKKYWDLYEPTAIKLADNPFAPKGAPKIALTNWGEMRAYSDIPKSGPVSRQMARRLVHGYYACVSYVDAQIGRVLAELDRLKLRESTVVLLWGDHGWKLGDHGMWCKHTNFEIDTHVPMILAAPGCRGGLRTRALVEFVDIYPTLCELCRLPLPAHLEGASFVPLTKDPARRWKPAAFSQYPRGKVMGYSMRTARHRFTQWLDRRTAKAVATELYDHEADPAGNVNIAARPENAALVARLAAQLERGWRAARP